MMQLSGTRAISFLLGSLLLASPTLAGETPSQPHTYEIVAKIGYTPDNLILPAGQSVTVTFKSDHTYDCSNSIIIPDLKYSVQLPPVGKAELTIPPQAKGTVIKGSCGMAMYHFKLTFE